MLKHFRSGSKRVRTLWWILTIGTVVTFIGGFIFIFGSGIGDVSRALTNPTVIGKVGDEEIGLGDFEAAMAAAQQQYQSQYGTAPQGRDATLLREQVWNNLVTERAVNAVARRNRVVVTDPEVLFAARNTPPPDISQNPAFMTNGRFDPNKWRQALADPSVNWSPLEERIRRTLPGQRLEERVVAGVKISEPELQRLYSNQYDRVQASIVLFPLDAAPVDSSRLDETALRKYYDEHKSSFTGTAEAQAEVVQIPRRVGEEEDRAARLEAETIVAEARGGTDFGQLARERSEGPFADRGGDLGQDIPLSRLPPALQAAIDSLAIGGVTDPIREGNTYFIFRLNERKATGPEPTFRLSQIQKPIRPSPESLQEDAELVLKLRKESADGNLAEVAARRQLVSVNTGWFGPNQMIPILIQLPQAQQWAGRAKKGEVSRAFSTETGWVLVQVTDRRESGPRPFDLVKDQVRRAAEIALRQQKPLADAGKLLDAVRAGQSLELAAAAAGVAVAATDTFPRSRPDARIGAFPRAVGMAFGLPAGQVGSPVAGDGGVIVVRKNLELPGSPAQYEQLKGSLSQTLLSNRQQRYLQAWVQDVVKGAEVKDLRQEIEESF